MPECKYCGVEYLTEESNAKDKENYCDKGCECLDKR